MSKPKQRFEILCTGIVQGVGFRPTVYRLATEMRLAGWVCNGPNGVEIEVEGENGVPQRFAERLQRELPPLAKVTSLTIHELEPLGETEFTVRETEQGVRKNALVPPDTRICADCEAEMQDEDDRRHQFAFTVCTNCGPRFSLVRKLPYDRDKTSMACFPLCSDCDREYQDPLDRRFHAEPVCCPKCGPKLWAMDCSGEELGEGFEAIDAAQRTLETGGVVAIKGLGGFQLACCARSDVACELLRTRKNRPRKPFAVMVKDLQTAQLMTHLTKEDEQLLLGPRSPIVLAPLRRGHGLSSRVSPGILDLGIMLPTTPLHIELFRNLHVDALVMTSGNSSDEPICRGNRESLSRLSKLADVFLLHDRDVIRRVDDSVVRSCDDGPVMVRRSRGWVPEPLPMPVKSPASIMAVGGHLQVTTCLGVGNEAYASQHIGDLDTVDARGFHREVMEGLMDFLEVRPDCVVVDPHPDYPSLQIGRNLADEFGAKVIEVQHHLAHVAAAAAEHNLFPEHDEKLGGIALDGTGWGPDGTAWGGELLEFNGLLQWQRVGNLAPLTLVGGEAAVREPWRIAVAALAKLGRTDLLPKLPLAYRVPPDKIEDVARLSGKDLWPRASGAGRLFEAAGALIGLRAGNTYEGEAALLLESLASRATRIPAAWGDLESLNALSAGTNSSPAGETLFPSYGLLAAMAKHLTAGDKVQNIAAGFHVTFCKVLAEYARKQFAPDIHTVVVSGGCMVNRMLRSGLTRELKSQGFEVRLPVEVPPGDGGLSYGQAVLGAVSLARNCEPAMMRTESCV